MTNTIKSLLFLFSFFLASVSFANNPGVSYQGRIFKPDGTALEGTTVQFRLQVRSPGSENCLLYEEVQTLNMAGSSGIFSITMNDGTGTRLDPATYQVDRIFANRDVMNLDSSRCAAGTSYTPNVADGRKLIVYFKDETMSAYEAMPIMNLNYVPQAMYALESQKVGTFAVTNILRAVDGSGNPVAAPALDPTQLTNLNNLLAGTSTQYATATAFNTVQTFAKSAPPTCSVGEVLKSNGTALSCVTPSASASYSGITAATATNTIDNLNFSQNWNWSTATTQSPMNMSANAITTGSLMSVATSSASLNSTNGLINVANTGASTTGILARFQSNSTVGSGLTVLTNGNVGIGTTSPASKLHVSGNVAVTENSPSLALTAAASGTTINLSHQPGSTYYSTINFITGGTSDFSLMSGGSNGDFFIESATAGTSLSILKSSGNVGIGTTTPGSTLEVNGSSNLNGSVKIGYYGASYFGGNGACKISSQAISTTPNTFTCTGMPASSEVAVTCSGTQAMTTPTGSAIYCRANGISNQVICNTTIANSVAMDWICSWVYLPSGN